MAELEKLDKEAFEEFSDVVDSLVHELGNSMMILSGHLEIYRENLEGNIYSPEVENLEHFLRTAQDLVDHAEIVARLPEEEVKELNDYAERHSDELESVSDVDLRSHVTRVARVSRDALAYQKKLKGGEVESMSIGDLLEPLEDSYERIGSNGSESSFNYNGFEETDIEAGYGLRMVSWTLGKNWEDHTNKADDLEFGFNVEETDCFYEVDVWDTGEGLYNGIPGKGSKSSEHRYRFADSLFDQEERTGQGLPMAQNIAELYDVDIFYSEEMLEGEGFGIKIKIPKY